MISFRSGSRPLSLLHEKSGLQAGEVTLSELRDHEESRTDVGHTHLERSWRQTPEIKDDTHTKSHTESHTESHRDVIYRLQWEQDTLLRWTEERGGRPIWGAQRKPWSGTSQSIDQSSWENLKYVNIKGLREWSRVRWVSLDLSAPLRPLSSPNIVIYDNPSSSKHRFHVLLRRDQTDPLVTAPMVSLDSSQKAVRDSANVELSFTVFQGITSSLIASLPPSEQALTELPLRIIIEHILAWIRTNLTYELSGGTPSVNVTLERGSGDCNELSQVFVKLISYFGVEAKMVFGIKHQSHERWSYHSWVKISAGDRWVDVDPTHGDIKRSLGYIPFASGDIEQQAHLESIIGRVYGEVLQWSRGQ